jgi:hypothetical protein
MDFRSLLSFFGKTFYLNLFESDRSSATRTLEMNPENTHETDMWARDPTGQSQGEGERQRQPQLAGGEASGEAKVTMRTTLISRTRWHTRGGQWSCHGTVQIIRIKVQKQSPEQLNSRT